MRSRKDAEAIDEAVQRSDDRAEIGSVLRIITWR